MLLTNHPTLRPASVCFRATRKRLPAVLLLLWLMDARIASIHADDLTNKTQLSAWMTNLPAVPPPPRFGHSTNFLQKRAVRIPDTNELGQLPSPTVPVEGGHTASGLVVTNRPDAIQQSLTQSVAQLEQLLDNPSLNPVLRKVYERLLVERNGQLSG